MDGISGVVSAGSMSTLVLEAIKKLIRVIIKNPEFGFSASFYLIMIPILNFLMLPLLALMGFPGYTMPVDWQGWLRTLVQIIVGSLISAGGYNAVVSPFKASFRSTDFRG